MRASPPVRSIATLAGARGTACALPLQRSFPQRRAVTARISRLRLQKSEVHRAGFWLVLLASNPWIDRQNGPMNRLAVALVTSALVSTAHAGVEVGGTAGAHVFSDSNALGVPDGSPVHHANSAFFGARLGFYFSTMLGVEAEGGVIPTESSGGNVKFDIYDAVGRAHVIAQFRADNPDNNIVPFVLGGAGIMKVMSISSTDPSLFDLEQGPFGYIGV